MTISRSPAPAGVTIDNDATPTQKPVSSRPRRRLATAAVVVAVAVIALLGGIAIRDRNSAGPSDASAPTAGATLSADLTPADLVLWAGIDYGSLASSR